MASKHVAVAVLTTLTTLSLAQRPALAQAFTHELRDGPKPWTGKPFDAPEDRFRFVIHSDITGGERPGVFEVAVDQMNLLRPEFVISVGDLIAGSDDPAAVEREWDDYERQVSALRAPVFLVGGNHDLMGPALREAWESRFGPRYYHFRYKGALFLVLDTEDHAPERFTEISRMRAEAFAVADREGWDAFAKMPYSLIPENAGGAISPEQAAYFERVLAANADARWTFVFLHKAPWLREDHVPWRRIETALADRRYTVFHGHKHGFQHQERQGADYIQLSTTGGVFLPENGRAVDQLVLVTVDDDTVEVANLLLGGILDRRGNIPRNGASLCMDSARCGHPE